MCHVEVFEHLVHSGLGHGLVGLLLSGAQPGHQRGLVLRGGDRRPQAALDRRGPGVVWEEAALRVAVGGGHRRLPCRVEEARRGETDREVVRPDHLGVRHGRRGLLTRKLSTRCRDGWSVGVISSTPPAVAIWKP